MSFHVDHEDLRAHARGVDEVAHSVSQAAATAAGVNLSGGAFGVLCGFLPPVLNTFAATSPSAIESAGNNLTYVAEAVRAMADDYRDSDEQIAARLRALGDLA